MSAGRITRHGVIAAGALALLISGCASAGSETVAEEADAANVVEEAPTAEPMESVEPDQMNQSDSSSDVFTLDEVAEHSTLDDCWIAVDGIVYDVSGFGPSHPGGASRIEQICGTDATNAFRGQHGTSGAPNSTLAGFEIGILG